MGRERTALALPLQSHPQPQPACSKSSPLGIGLSHQRCKPVHFHTKSEFMLQPPPPCSSLRAPGSPCPAARAPGWGEAGRKTLTFLHGLLKPVTGRVRKVAGAPRKEINACKGNWTGKFQIAPATGEASKGSNRAVRRAGRPHCPALR